MNERCVCKLTFCIRGENGSNGDGGPKLARLKLRVFVFVASPQSSSVNPPIHPIALKTRHGALFLAGRTNVPKKQPEKSTDTKVVTSTHLGGLQLYISKLLI